MGKRERKFYQKKAKCLNVGNQSTAATNYAVPYANPKGDSLAPEAGKTQRTTKNSKT